MQILMIQENIKSNLSSPKIILSETDLCNITKTVSLLKFSNCPVKKIPKKQIVLLDRFLAKIVLLNRSPTD